MALPMTARLLSERRSSLTTPPEMRLAPRRMKESIRRRAQCRTNRRDSAAPSGYVLGGCHVDPLAASLVRRIHKGQRSGSDQGSTFMMRTVLKYLTRRLPMRRPAAPASRGADWWDFFAQQRRDCMTASGCADLIAMLA